MDKMTMDFIADPGHGWLRVAPDQAAALGITKNDLTNFSFVCRETGALYAEEDCDLAIVFAAHHKATGCLPLVKDTFTDRSSPIRNMPRCTGIHADWKAAHAYLDANAKRETV